MGKSGGTGPSTRLWKLAASYHARRRASDYPATPDRLLRFDLAEYNCFVPSAFEQGKPALAYPHPYK